MKRIDYETNPLDIMLRRGKWQKDLSYFHWHDKIEIIKCLKESFGVLIDGERFEVNAGDLIIIGEQKIHNFYIYENDTNYQLLQFPLSLLLNNGVIPSPVRPVIRAGELSENEKLSGFIKAIFDILEYEGNVPSGCKNPVAENMCSALYFLLMEHFGENETSLKHEKSEFYKILKFVNDNFTSDITVSGVADALFMDRGRLSKLFTKYSGMKLNAYINTLRMSKTLFLIEKGESVSRAALDSGFQSVRTFNNVYKSIKQKPTETKK